jgi:hypothetical protein
VFCPHLGNDNLAPLQNLIPSLVFVHQECSLFAQGYLLSLTLLSLSSKAQAFFAPSA